MGKLARTWANGHPGDRVIDRQLCIIFIIFVYHISQDFIKALRKESQSVMADLLRKEYFDLRESEFKAGRCPELKNHLMQQHPTSGKVNCETGS